MISSFQFLWKQICCCPKKDSLYITLGPCVGLLVAVLYMISKFVDLANCTLKIHLYWIILRREESKQREKQRKKRKKRQEIDRADLIQDFN